ncbi:MAG: hypothetical protein HY360_22610 [Verrucomicrobia bacterium]|nr:hypothetical protein [Verrucomicrobiota bacterium]
MTPTDVGENVVPAVIVGKKHVEERARRGFLIVSIVSNDNPEFHRSFVELKIAARWITEAAELARWFLGVRGNQREAEQET